MPRRTGNTSNRDDINRDAARNDPARVRDIRENANIARDHGNKNLGNVMDSIANRKEAERNKGKKS